MEKILVDLENCFGIGKLRHEFNFEKSKTHLIYAPNGTMKTSFARTFELISKNDSRNLPGDRIYDERIPKCEILVDNLQINPISILVVNAEDNSFDASSKISSFLASRELKERYDTLYEELNSLKSEYIKRLKVISQSTDCESEFVNTFAKSENATFFETMLLQIENLNENYEKLNFRYNDVFDKKGNVKKFLEANRSILDQYVSNYKELISKSKFFKESANSTFGTYQANEILKSTEDNSYFDAGHKFVLEDGTEIDNAEKLREIVQDEIQSLLNDEKLKKAFEKVDKAIGANAELRSFQKVTEKDNLILVNLKDYEKFKKEVWINYLSEIKSESEELATKYKDKKNELESIIEASKQDFSLWKKIIKTFNSRFFVPFKIIIVNQPDIVLKQDTANLEFDYADNNEAPKRQKRDNLLKILSKGEQRAYFILQFLFEIESRKLHDEKSLLIFDDVADSFDYKNKFAIIEYIKDLHNLENFRIIVLTHNFDFYRTIASRLGLPRQVVFMATKSEGKQITLHSGQYRKDVFTHFIGRFAEPKVFISLIAFVRNIIEYSESDDCPEYLTLTSCLHQKIGSDELTANDLFNIYCNRLVKLKGRNISFGSEKVVELIFRTANLICDEENINEILLENKIALAIAIRLKAEEYLISKLTGFDPNAITSNQTQVLYKNYREAFPESESLNTIDRVNLMTPENIHINAFMYEPLIDMSVHHLKELYRETCSLN